MTSEDKKQYWTYRNLSAAEKKKVRELDRKKLIVAVHDKPDWPAKPVGKKRAEAIERNKQLAMIADLNATLFMMDHETHNTPVRKNCYYCQETRIYRDGVCVGHWQFLFENMDNRTRMKEKAYHREMRRQELLKKREESRKEREQVAA